MKLREMSVKVSLDRLLVNFVDDYLALFYYRPVSTYRSYKKLNAYEKGFFGLPGLHCLTLTYNFDAPFKSDSTIFDFRRLTSLLYDSDVVQTIYYVYDSYGRFYGHGSYQVLTSPKYRFKLKKGSYTLVAKIYVADTMKISYTGKESDTLDKLASCSLLIRWPLNSSSSQLSSGTNASTPPLTLELSTSLATLSLADVDYEKSCSRLLLHNTNASSEIIEAGANVDSTPKSSKKDSVFGKLQVFPTVPWHLAAGEGVTEYFGIINENLATFVSPGSYFECQMSYYGHRDLKKSVQLPLEIFVGPKNTPSATNNVKSPLKGVFGLQAEDLLHLRWIALGHFGLNGSHRYWVSPFEISKQSENPSLKKQNIKDGCAEKSKSPKDEFQSYVLKFFQAVESISVFKSNRLEVWEEVNLAMKELTACVAKMGSGILDESIKYLLPKVGDAMTVSCDESALGSHTPVLIYNEVTINSEKTADVSVESAGSEIATTVAKKIKAMSAKQLANRATAIEVLCTYGRFLCEQIVLAPKSASIYRKKLLECLQEIISRIHYLFLLSNAEPESIRRPMRNFFDTEDTKSAATLGLTVPLIEKIKPSFELFWLAHLFVLHPQLPLLEALTRLSYQIDNLSAKGSYQSLLRNADPARDRVVTDCASIAFSWMIVQLQRMGLPNVARYLEHQLPSMFPQFDYNLVLSEPLQPNLPMP
nr:tripeptidyl peptidase II (S08 family) [Hymenolepis microstoma]